MTRRWYAGLHRDAAVGEGRWLQDTAAPSRALCGREHPCREKQEETDASLQSALSTVVSQKQGKAREEAHRIWSWVLMENYMQLYMTYKM